MSLSFLETAFLHYLGKSHNSALAMSQAQDAADDFCKHFGHAGGHPDTPYAELIGMRAKGSSKDSLPSDICPGTPCPRCKRIPTE